MSITIPTTEPVAARAGDSWKWTRLLADYPASTWTLTYTFINSAAKISIVASADGDTHSVSVLPATTGAYTTGRYDWVAHATDGTDNYQVDAGVFQLLPDVASAATYDGRSHARVMLEAIDAILEGQATTGQLDLVSTAHNNRSLTRDPIHLIKLRQRYAATVRAEDDAQRVARGELPSRLVQVRFVG